MYGVYRTAQMSNEVALFQQQQGGENERRRGEKFHRWAKRVQRKLEYLAMDMLKRPKEEAQVKEYIRRIQIHEARENVLEVLLQHIPDEDRLHRARI